MADKKRSAPQRRRGETRGEARKRWRMTGVCQSCGRKKNTKGPLCWECAAKRRDKKGPPKWQ